MEFAQRGSFLVGDAVGEQLPDLRGEKVIAQPHGRERRREVLSDFDIIETGDRHVSRDLEAVFAERADDAYGEQVIGGNDALGRLFVPGEETLIPLAAAVRALSVILTGQSLACFFIPRSVIAWR